MTNRYARAIGFCLLFALAMAALLFALGPGMGSVELVTWFVILLAGFTVIVIKTKGSSPESN